MASELGTLTAGLEKPNIDTMANYYLGNLIKAQRIRKRMCTRVGKCGLTVSILYEGQRNKADLT